MIAKIIERHQFKKLQKKSIKLLSTIRMSRKNGAEFVFIRRNEHGFVASSIIFTLFYLGIIKNEDFSEEGYIEINNMIPRYQEIAKVLDKHRYENDLNQLKTCHEYNKFTNLIVKTTIESASFVESSGWHKLQNN